MIVSGRDQYCRYLPAPGCGLGYRFGNFLKELNLSLEGDELREFVRAGWLQPILRVRLPDSFFLSWNDYPLLSFRGDFAEEDRWAIGLFSYSATSPQLAALHTSGRTENWYTHYLDDPRNEIGQQARAHAISTEPGALEPPPLQHPRHSQLIYPWIDYFAYWQAYQIAEILDARRMVGPLLNEPDAEDKLEAIRQALPSLRESSDLGLRAIQTRWQQYRPVFEWVSHFRTLLGAWHTTEGWEVVNRAASQLLATLGLTPESLKQGICDILLTQYEFWRPRAKHDDGRHKALRALLQEDIQRSVCFLSTATGEDIDYDDPCWAVPEDGCRRVWAPLLTALPFEYIEVKRGFSIQAPVYLSEVNTLLGETPLDEKAIATIVRDHWSASVALRRFCLSFQRLHEHFRSEKDDRIGLRARTPIEFLILCALHAEKVLLEAFLKGKVEDEKLPDVVPLILDQAKSVLETRGAIGVAAGLDELRTTLREKGNLRKLHLDPKDPFTGPQHFAWGTPIEKYLLACFANLGILRNYAAHHDCLDEELIYTPLGETAVEAVLVPTLLVLRAGSVG